MRTSRTRWFYCTNSIDHKVSYLKMLQQLVLWEYRSYLKWYFMLIQASTKIIQLQTVVQLKLYICSFNWFNIREDCLLFLVSQAFMVFIMHELDYRKNLLQKCTVIRYCCAALAIFEVVQFSDAHAWFVQKSGKIVEFKSYIYAINMLDMHDERLLFLVL